MILAAKSDPISFEKEKIVLRIPYLLVPEISGYALPIEEEEPLIERISPVKRIVSIINIEHPWDVCAYDQIYQIHILF